MEIGNDSPDAPKVGTWDHLTTELQALRSAQGEPSYAEIARRVVEHRKADGAHDHAARIARSTVHWTFQPGRARINEPLIREVVRALGAQESLVDTWIAQCRSDQTGATEASPATEAVEVPPASTKQAVLLALACVVLNLAGREFVDFFTLPVYLDMVGTAVAAIALGPWRGAAVGTASNLIGVVGSGWVSVPFALVNIVGALVWGYGVRRWRMGQTLPRFFLLNLLAAVACSAVAVPILEAVYGESFRAGHDAITQIVEQSISTPLVAVSFSNLMTSIGDKLISGFVALVAVSALPPAFRHGFDLILATDTTLPDAGARQQ